MSRPRPAEQNIGIIVGMMLIALVLMVAGCMDTRSATVLYVFGSKSCRQCWIDRPHVPRPYHYIDVDQDEGMAQHYRIRRLPTYIVIRGGKVICRTNDLNSLKRWKRKHGQR